MFNYVIFNKIVDLLKYLYLCASKKNMVMQENSKFQLSLLFLLFAGFTFAQVGIGTPDPDRSAMLQINSKDKGVLLPSISLESIADQTTIQSPADGLIVWNNGKAGLPESGFYYWYASKWNKISTTASARTTAKLKIPPILKGPVFSEDPKYLGLVIASFRSSSAPSLLLTSTVEMTILMVLSSRHFRRQRS